MKMSFRVTLWAGARTEITVDVYSTAVNEKTVKLANGEVVTSSEIERFLKAQLLEAFKKIEARPRAKR